MVGSGHLAEFVSSVYSYTFVYISSKCFNSATVGPRDNQKHCLKTSPKVSGYGREGLNKPLLVAEVKRGCQHIRHIFIMLIAQ